jgi:hypothetical protein
MGDSIVEYTKTNIKYSYKPGKDENKDVYYLYEITLPNNWSSNAQSSLSLVPYSNNGTNYPTVIGYDSEIVKLTYNSLKPNLQGLKLTCDSNEHIISIGRSAFEKWDTLISVNLSGCKKLQTICEYAFDNCTALTSVDLRNCTELIRIDVAAFFQCGTLTSINLSGCTKLQSINNDAFFECVKLE